MLKWLNKILLIAVLSCVLIPVDAQRIGIGAAANLWNRLYGGAGVPLDSLATFTVQPHANDTAIVTAVDFDPNATNYQLRYLQGLTYPTISTGTQVLSNADSAEFQGLKVKIDVPSDNTNYAFRLYSTGADTVFNSDTVQLDMIPSPYDSTKFYVSNTGNDSNTGTNQDSSWLTISKVNGETFDPGDEILFNKGDTWREALTVPSSGTSGDYITFSSYGTGAKPQILGSTADSTWDNPSGDIWRCGTYANPFTGEEGWVWYEETDGSVTWGDEVVWNASFSNFSSEHDCAWNNDSIYVYSTENPGTAYTKVEIGQRDRAIDLNGKSYLEINGLEVGYSQQQNIYNLQTTDNVTDLIIRYVNSHYCGRKDGHGYGIGAAYSNMLFEYDTISNAGRRGISIYNYGDHNFSNLEVRYCEIYDGFHTTGIDVGTGTIETADGNLDSLKIHHNYIHDPKDGTDYATALIQLNATHITAGTGRMNRVYIYNNILEYAQASAISILDSVTNLYIDFNTFKGFNTQRTNNSFLISYGADTTLTATFRNNIFYNDAPATNLGAIGIYLSNNDYVQVSDDYNLHYSEIADNRITHLFPPYTAYTMATWSNLVSTEGWETNGPVPAFPMVYPSTFYLNTASHAIDSGVAIDYVTDDYYGNARGTPPNVGAAETTFNGDTAVSFIASEDNNQDSLVVVVIDFTAPPDSIVMVADAGNDAIGRDAGDQLYAGSDTSAVNDTYFYDSPTDTIVTVEMHLQFSDIWCDTPNTDTCMVDSVGSPSPYDDVKAAFTTAPHDTMNTKYQALVDGLDSDGVWDKLDGFVLCATHSQANNGVDALINWINPGTMNGDTVHNPGWDAYEGWNFNSFSNGFVSSNFTPNTDGTLFTQNSACIGIFVYDDDGDLGEAIGVTDGTNQLRIDPTNGTNAVWWINDANSDYAANTTNIGHYHVNRTASNAREMFVDAVSLDSDAQTSSGLPTAEVWVGTYNNNGSEPNFAFHNTIICYYWGEEFTQSDITNIRTRVNTYMTSNGK